MFGKRRSEFQSTLVQNIECILSEKCQLVQSINEAEWCVCLLDKVGQPCVCVCYRRCGGEFYPQRIQCQWPITRIITEFLPSVLRDKRVIWENVIGVIASSVWACKLYEGWACLSVLVKVKLELHVSYHMYCPPFFLKLWHKKSIKPFFSSNCHHSLTTSLSARYQSQR